MDIFIVEAHTPDYASVSVCNWLCSVIDSGGAARLNVRMLPCAQARLPVVHERVKAKYGVVKLSAKITIVEYRFVRAFGQHGRLPARERPRSGRQWE